MNFYESIITNGYNPDGVLFTFFLWILMFLLANPQRTFVNPAQNRTSSGVGQFMFFFFIVCVLGLHQWDTYHITNLEHLEPTHQWLYIQLANGMKLPYRLVVFGGTVCIYGCIAKQLDVYSRNFCLACALLLVTSMFCEMRATIGYTLLLLGFVLLINEKHCKPRIVCIVAGITCVISALFFHRSVFLCATFAIISLVNFDRKWTILASWIAYPFLITLIPKLFPTILSTLSLLDFGDMGITESIEYYGEGEFSFGQFNLVGLIVRFITRSTNYVVLFYLTYKLCFNKSIKLEFVHRYLFRWYYVCMYVGGVLSSTELNAWLGTRVSAMAIYAAPLVLARIWQSEKRATVWTKVIILCGIIGNTMSLLIKYRDWNNLL